MLICPECKSELKTMGPFLVCQSGKHTWPVTDGVPIMVDQDAKESTAEAFAFKWRHSPDETFEERVRVATTWYYDRFFGGVSDVAGLAEALKGKRRILDVGCGLGNMTRAFAEQAPEAEVWGLDLTPVVLEARRLHRSTGIRFVQGDLFKLPISGEFDFISADGVLHHTASTREAFKALAAKLAIGGDLLAYVYKRKAPIREYCDDYIRSHTTRMPPEQCMAFSRAMVFLGRQLREANVTLKFDEAIPLLGIAAGEMDLQRWFYWHVLKCFWDDGGNEVASVLENFDWYAPPMAWRHTEPEVRGWAQECGLDVVQIRVADSGISVWCRRTA